jgi:hypothetical protein
MEDEHNFDFCPCTCHEDGEPYCGNCFEDHVIPGLKEVREID